MKKTILFLSVLSLLMIATACGAGKLAKLKADIKEANKDCPVDLPEFGEISKVDFNDDKNCVEFYFKITNPEISVNELSENAEVAKQLFMLTFLSADEGMELVDEMIGADAGLALIFTDIKGKNNLRVDFTVDELKSIRKTERSMSDTQLNEAILKEKLDLLNESCPIPMDEGMEITRVYDDGSNIVYDCRIDENLYSIADIRSNLSANKEAIKDMFDESGSEEEIDLYREAGKGLVYHFYGNRSGATADIKFSLSELE